MKNTLYLFLLFSIISCAPQKKTNINGQTVTIYRPPGTVEIADNFYADETELKNIDYKEYLYWIKKVYGVNSTEYLEILPDTTVWTNQIAADFGAFYFHDWKYDHYPVVGVSLEQAKKYTEWRTERVTEMLLVSKKYIKPNPDATSKNHFTIERYLKGNYDWIIVKSDFVNVPKYKLPNSKEWELIAKGNSTFKYGTDPDSKYNQKVLKKNLYLFNTQEKFSANNNKEFDWEKKKLKSRTALSNDFSKNINGLFSTIGNVAELVAEGKTKGGSWQDALEDISIEASQPFDAPNCWTGFRNVCVWEVRKVGMSD